MTVTREQLYQNYLSWANIDDRPYVEPLTFEEWCDWADGKEVRSTEPPPAVGLILKREQVTAADMEWAVRKARELGLMPRLGGEGEQL